MSKIRILGEWVSLFVISLFVGITGILAFSGLYSFIADKDVRSVVPAIIFLALFAATIIFWIMGLNIFRKDITAETSSKYLGILLPLISMVLAIALSYLPLSYFGFFDNPQPLPDRCLTSTGFACISKPILKPDTIILYVQNGLGYPVNLTNANIIHLTNSSCKGIYLCPYNDTTCTNEHYVLEYEAITTISIYGCDFSDGTRVKGEISIGYINPNQIPETMRILIDGKIEK